jgi:hypothetical protein
MKRFFLAFFCTVLFQWAWAQQSYFIYLQTENELPFYVKMDGQVYSSSEHGFIILPNLMDSSYQFFLGSSDGYVKESKFIVEMKAADHGYLLRNEEGYFSLVHLQKGYSVKSLQDQSLIGVTFIKRSDAFSALLSKSLGDTSLLYMPVYAKAELAAENKPTKTETSAINTADAQLVTQIADTENKDSSAVIAQGHSADPVMDSMVVKVDFEKDTASLGQITSNSVEVTPDSTETATEKYTRSVIKQYSESSNAEGFGLVFIDDNNGTSTDTIRLLIPNPKIIFSDKDSVRENDNFFLEVKKEITQNKITSNDSLMDASVTEVKPVPSKNNCKSVATESEVLKLRRSMVLQPTDEGMITEVRKLFKKKCLTTEHVKMLSSLFITNAGKYQLYDAAYDFVSDKDAFPGLQAQLTDTYYLNRFKALIGE